MALLERKTWTNGYGKSVVLGAEWKLSKTANQTFFNWNSGWNCPFNLVDFWWCCFRFFLRFSSNIPRRYVPQRRSRRQSPLHHGSTPPNPVTKNPKPIKPVIKPSPTSAKNASAAPVKKSCKTTPVKKVLKTLTSDSKSSNSISPTSNLGMPILIIWKRPCSTRWTISRRTAPKTMCSMKSCSNTPPHIHIKYGEYEYEAFIELITLNIIEGSLPKRCRHTSENRLNCIKTNWLKWTAKIFTPLSHWSSVWN